MPQTPDSYRIWPDLLQAPTSIAGAFDQAFEQLFDPKTGIKEVYRAQVDDLTSIKENAIFLTATLAVGEWPRRFVIRLREGAAKEATGSFPGRRKEQVVVRLWRQKGKRRVVTQHDARALVKGIGIIFRSGYVRDVLPVDPAEVQEYTDWACRSINGGSVIYLMEGPSWVTSTQVPIVSALRLWDMLTKVMRRYAKLAERVKKGTDLVQKTLGKSFRASEGADFLRQVCESSVLARRTEALNKAATMLLQADTSAPSPRSTNPSEVIYLCFRLRTGDAEQPLEACTPEALLGKTGSLELSLGPIKASALGMIVGDSDTAELGWMAAYLSLRLFAGQYWFEDESATLLVRVLGLVAGWIDGAEPGRHLPVHGDKAARLVKRLFSDSSRFPTKLVLSGGHAGRKVWLPAEDVRQFLSAAQESWGEKGGR